MNVRNRLDRRRFLLGAGGTMLALPMLETFAPRRSFAQAAKPPLRLVILGHAHGRIVGNGKGVDWWSPGATSGPLPANGTAASPLLAAIAAINNEVVTFDGIDDVFRHTTGETDGHHAADRGCLTCSAPVGYAQAGGPSLDYVAGLRLRASDSMAPSVIVPLSATPAGITYFDPKFWGAAGTLPHAVSGNPQMAVAELFGPPAPAVDNPSPPALTLRDRLTAQRSSILDGVAKGLTDLSGRVSARDKQRLDEHATFIRSLELQLAGGGGGGTPTESCARPDETQMPHVMPSTSEEFAAMGRNPDWERGNRDAETVHFQVENLVQALACDVTRVGCLSYWGDPLFTSEFSGTSPFAESESWHTTVHGTPRLTDSAQQATDAEHLKTGFQAIGKTFTLLVQRLAAIRDTDGSRLLDNTLVLWISEMGYGPEHTNFNLPVVMAGLGSAFEKGRHIVESRRTTGDLHAHVLRLLGGTDQTFGEVTDPSATVGSVASARGVVDLLPGNGLPGYISASTALYGGPLSL